MKKNNTDSKAFTRFLFNNKFINIGLDRLLMSLRRISGLGMIFSGLFLGIFIYRLFAIQLTGEHHFKLPVSGWDLSPILSKSHFAFYCISSYEVIKIGLIFGMAYYFWKFASSVDYKNPFSNYLSRNFIGAAATLSLLYFPIDVISSLHYHYFGKMNEPNTSIIGYFHWDYLFVAYFINVFAIIFRRGGDLKDELDLVI